MNIKESFLGILVVTLILILIIPVPSWLLDILIMLNISVSLLILLNAIYAKEALEMSLFPTILLVTTLFRIAINVSSTKLMLGTGFAGKVIEQFGMFVAGGNMIVGGIIFIILLIVNFMVITKGSERVAEVTARFTLDAMPGKQMAIDADLNAGLIDEQQAKERRDKIAAESSFFGAMDGATKFVKGDAIAGIIITLVNIIGGIILGTTGIANGGVPMTIGEAANRFTLMTIGDGLVGQIPSLLIATATGILVTKSNGGEGISAQVVRQIFMSPLVMYVTGIVLLILSITPLPFLVFAPAGILFIIMGYRLSAAEKIQEVKEEINTTDEEAEEIRKPENVVSLLNVDPIVLMLGYGLIPLADSSQGGDLLDRLVMIRRQIALELGAVVPIIRIRDNIRLNPNEYKIMIKGVEVGEGDILFDHYMAMNSGYVEEEIEGIETVEPYLGLPALWISEGQRERAEALGYTVVDPPAIIATHLTEVIRNHLYEIITRQDVQTLIDTVKENNKILVDELIPKQLSIGDIQKVLANLLNEGISIRDLVTILETLADYSSMTRDTDMLTEYVRQALKRSISSKYFSKDSSNQVITLDPAVEQLIMNNIQQSEHGNYLALDPNMSKQIFDKINVEVNKLASRGVQPIILTSPIVRIYFKRMIDQVAPELIVLSYNEVDPNTEIQSIGMVSVN